MRLRQASPLGGAFLVLAVGLQLLLMAHPSRAQEAASIRIRHVTLDPNGSTRLVVSLGGLPSRALAPSDFRVVEGAETIEQVSVEQLRTSTETPVSLALVMDTSGSTAGRPIADAKAAAKRFVVTLPPSVRVSVIAFSDRVRTVSGFTTNRTATVRGIDSLRAQGGTALYEGVRVAATRLGALEGIRTIVLFSDGKDTESAATLRDAVVAARAAKAQVTSVGLRAADYDGAALATLASATGGTTIAVTQSTRLDGAFGAVAREIASQYVLSYRSTATEPKDLELTVSFLAGSAPVSDRVVTINTRDVDARPRPEPNVVSAPAPPVAAFASSAGFWIGIGAVFLAVLFILGVLLMGTGDRDGTKMLRGVSTYLDRRRPSTDDAVAQSAASALGKKAGDLIELMPKSARATERLQQQLERAGWPMRASEFIALRVVAGVGGLVLGFGLFGKLWLGVVFVALAALAPRAILGRRIEKRSSAFLAQLPETLDLLAGSLQAGYGFMQALDTLVRESPEPTSVEFGRVLTEARLGMPVEDALNAMAERIDSDDFRWVVLAVNIQRQVGGNLAVLLKTVSGTLREREQVRRQIKVLSAEGRLSAAILTALPFLLAGYIMVVNPDYISKLYTQPMGRMMIGFALVMMAAGIAWMRKLIRIDV